MGQSGSACLGRGCPARSTLLGGGDIVDACELLVDHRVDNPLYDPGRGTRLPQRCRLAVCGSCSHISVRIRHYPTLFGTSLLGPGRWLFCSQPQTAKPACLYRAGGFFLVHRRGAGGHSRDAQFCPSLRLTPHRRSEGCHSKGRPPLCCRHGRSEGCHSKGRPPLCCRHGRSEGCRSKVRPPLCCRHGRCEGCRSKVRPPLCCRHGRSERLQSKGLRCPSFCRQAFGPNTPHLSRT